MSHPLLPDLLVAAARTKIGFRESGGNNRGKALSPFFLADSYDPNGAQPGDEGYAWCASFICWVFKEAMGNLKWSFPRPTTPAAFGFEKWCLSIDDSILLKRSPGRDIIYGDIVIFSISHIGIATSSPDASGNFRTIEGNTGNGSTRDGDGVYERTRNIKLIRSRLRPTV